MRRLTAPLARLSLAARVTVVGLLAITVSVLAVEGWSAWRHHRADHAALDAQLERDLVLLDSLTARVAGGGAWRLTEAGRLARGDVVLEGANDLVDMVRAATGARTAIFRGDEVVAGTGRPDGSRLTGQRTATGPHRDTALGEGRVYRGPTRIEGAPHIAIYSPIRDAGGKVIGMLFVGQSRATMDAALMDRLWHALVAKLLLVALAGGLLWVGLRRSLRPLEELRQWVAAGVAEQPVPHLARRDELGSLARALEENRTAAQEKARLEAALRAAEEGRKRRSAAMERSAEEFGSNVGSVMAGFEDSASTMLTATTRLSDAMGRTSAQVTETAGHSAESNANLQAVASAVEELAASVSEISNQVSRAAVVAAEAVTEAQRGDTRIEALTRSADRIGDILNVISDVASRTNLLALNATIEAARAGEAGKGFAVVASEVKNLATQTAGATQDVAAQIAAIRQATAEAAQGMRAISAAIGRMDEVAGGIAAAVEEQGAATREITGRLQLVARGNAQVADTMAEVARMAEAAADATLEVESSAATVQGEAGVLRAEVDGFLATLHEQMEERRRFDRLAVEGRDATLVVEGATERLRLLDISLGGAALRRGEPLPPDAALSIALPGAGGPVTGRVVRWEEGVLAISFDQPIGTAVMEAVTRELGIAA
ncbi:methyl-accepting chemotaxis protein [Roseococcus thiosulfatophilus]|uniref:methyl-accepting chemotaxis protein n=1 Tax=Roseococcus thiosulfatophilus TaxID=35813 RepID=UPI001A8EC796|nr:methyl-accepting chemotaxis protein [Roseococcus thiosulfatophilus]